jgi:TP901 family phage tail tape measure protein
MATTTVRDLKIELDADARKLDAAFERARRSTMRLETQLRQADLAAASLDKQLADEANKAAAQRARSMEQLGRGLAAFGLATAAGLGLAAKAAIDWESAWAGVTKTVDGSPEQMAALESELRDLAMTLPAAHAEIAGVAEAAGQLGVERGAVAAFTKTMIDLSETTNLTADAAATAIAQLGNVLRLDLKNDVDNFGAALVALGNDGASTEADILSMAQRIGGAGATLGMSAQDVLGFAAALSNVGIEAEAGGSSISTAMIKIAEAVDKGGSKLDIFAETAGMSAADFTAAFRDDPAQAIATFIEGLGGVEAAGGSVFQVLESLGLSEIRVRDALMRLSQSSRGVATDLNLSARAWEENTALIEEAEKRYETTEAKIQIAKNTLVDLAIDVGGVLLPVLTELVESVAGIFRWFSDLPGPVQSVATVMAALGAAGALAAGGFLLLAPRMNAAHDAMLQLARTNPVLAGGLMSVGSALAKLTVVGTAVVIARQLGDALKDIGESGEAAVDGVGGATKELLKLNDGIRSQNVDAIVKDVDDLNNAWSSWFLRMDKGDGTLGRSRDNLETMSDALASMVQSGHLDEAAQGYETLKDRLIDAGANADEVKDAFGSYHDELAKTEAANDLAGDAVGETAAALQDQAAAAGMSADQLDEAKKAVEELLKAWSQNLADMASPLDAWESAVQTAAQGASEAATGSKDAWQDFTDTAVVNIGDFIAELEKQVEAQDNFLSNISTIAERGFPELAEGLLSAGPAMADAAAGLVDGTDDQLARANELWPRTTSDGMMGVSEEMRKWIPIAGQIGADYGADVAAEIGASIAAGETTVAEALAGLNLAIEENVPGQITTKVDLDPTDFYLKGTSVAEETQRLTDMWAVPKADLDAGPFFGVESNVRDSLLYIEQAAPVAHGYLDIEEFESDWGRSMAMLLGLDSERPVPEADIDISAMEESIAFGNRQLAGMDANDPRPEARLLREKLQQDLIRAQAIVNSLKGTTVQSSVAPPSQRNIASVLATIRRHFSGITVPVTVGQPGFGVLGGSGGGSGGSSAGGGWTTPMNRGSYSVGSPFGMRNGKMHTGQDLPARTGTAVFAARPGRVSRAMTMSGSYGNHVFVDHAGGWQTRYAHLSSRNVAAGTSVGAGRQIGRVGSTGNSTGPHLHFEIRSGGRALNPRNYLRFARGGPIEGPGGAREDRIPILASNGEFMQQAAAVRHYGRDFMHAVNDMTLPKFWRGGYVGASAGSTGTMTRVVNVNLMFGGPVGSQRELQTWLTGTLDDLRRQGRLN